MDYRKITLEDRTWINSLISMEQGLATDNCFGTYYLWGDIFGLRLSRYEDRLLACCMAGNELSFFYPHGRGDLKAAVLEMEQYARSKGADLLVNGVTRTQKEQLEQALPGYFTFQEKRGRADYLYEAESLAALSGKKLHSKKNHCNRFERDWPDWHSEELKKEHAGDCFKLLERWEERRQDAPDEMQEAEKLLLARTFEHYRELEMEGIVLFAGGSLVGFSLGEMMGEDGRGFDVHFEKADAGVSGAYAMVNRELARMLLARHPNLHYLNREEDMGLENLRKAKESYKPAFLIEKYSARIR